MQSITKFGAESRSVRDVVKLKHRLVKVWSD